MGPWPWRGDCHGLGCPADAQQHQLKLAFISAGKISLFWEKLLWEIKGSSCCLFITHFWLRMTSRDLNHKEKGKHSTISGILERAPALNSALPTAADHGQN